MITQGKCSDHCHNQTAVHCNAHECHIVDEFIPAQIGDKETHEDKWNREVADAIPHVGPKEKKQHDRNEYALHTTDSPSIGSELRQTSHLISPHNKYSTDVWNKYLPKPLSV